MELIILVAVTTAALLAMFAYWLSETKPRQTRTEEAIPLDGGDLQSDEEQRRQFSDMLDRVTYTASFSSIRTQIATAIDGKEIPDDGVFDTFVRAYLLGYVDSSLRHSKRGNLDETPHEVANAFSAICCDYVAGESNGIDLLNECLKERTLFRQGANGLWFEAGFDAGRRDYQDNIEGLAPARLHDYLNSRLSESTQVRF